MSDSPFVPHAVLIDRRWFIQRFGEPRIAFPAASMNLQWNADWLQLRSAVVEGWLSMSIMLFSWLFVRRLAMISCLVRLLMALCSYLVIPASQAILFVVASWSHAVGRLSLSCVVSGSSLVVFLLVDGGVMFVGPGLRMVFSRLSVSHLRVTRSFFPASSWFPSSFPLSFLEVSGVLFVSRF